MSKSHEDKVAVVTGAGQGIGQAYARRLAENGADVVVVDMAQPDETIALIQETGARGIAHVGDISDPDTASAVASTVEKEFGRCDILVNNAGIYPMAPLRSWTLRSGDTCSPSISMRCSCSAVLSCRGCVPAAGDALST